MIKSLTAIRIVVVFVVSIIISLGVSLLEVHFSIFTSWITVFLFTLVLMEVGRLIVNQVVKNKGGTFFVFCLSFLIVGFVLSSLLLNSITLNELAFSQIKFYLAGVIMITGVFQAVYFWIRRNGQQRVLLILEKQAYLQHSFNDLKSQNVIEFLQYALKKTIALIKKDPNLAVLQIEKLTSILRYLLQSRDEKFVRLGAELENVREYCELAEVQLDNAVNLSVNISGQFHETGIPPLVFQMVLDNQFKSFAETGEAELNIEVYIENKKFVVVKTSLPPSIENISKNEKFINNLKQRYQLYNKASGISELSTATEYFVKFPLVVG